MFSETLHCLLCFSRSNLNGMLFWFFLINYHIYFFAYCMLSVTCGSTFMNSFSHLWPDHNILLNFFIYEGVWFARINPLFNEAIVLKTDGEVSLKCFRSLSLIFKLEFLSLFSTWSLKRVLSKNYSCCNFVLLVFVLQKMILGPLESFCGSRREPGFELVIVWDHLLWSDQHTWDWWDVDLSIKFFKLCI